MGADEVGSARDVLVRMLSTVEQSKAISDSAQLIQDILESEIVLDRGIRKTVSEIISPEAVKLDPMQPKALERYGIGIVTHASVDWFFVAHRAVSRHLLKGTTWDGQNIDEILRRVPGAVKCKKRLAGSQPWGVVIPIPELRLSGS